MTVFLIKITGLAIAVAVAAFAGLIYVNASKLEKKIEAENRGANKE